MNLLSKIFPNYQNLKPIRLKLKRNMQKLLDKQKKLEELAARKQEQLQLQQQSKSQDFDMTNRKKLDSVVSNPNRKLEI